MSPGMLRRDLSRRFLLLLLFFFLTPVLNSRGKKKITLCNIKKYKNQAGMNLTPPPPYYYYLFCSLAVFDPSAGHTMEVLTPRISVIRSV